MNIKDIITEGKTALGIEFGSTRVKAVLIDENAKPLASGSYDWENKFEGGYWTYSMDEVKTALKTCFGELQKDVQTKYDTALKTVGAMGVSAMMHGYLAFDEEWNLLAPFRTWRNTTTGEAATELTEALGFNIPQRWTCAHIYQAILNGEEHIPNIAHVTTLAGYVHYLLTGVNAVGIGEASGIFPIDSENNCYNGDMVKIFDEKTKAKGFGKSLTDILPDVLLAGDNAGYLTAEGVKLLTDEGDLAEGVPFAPCEGDAGTGMTATNSVREKTGNISAGTSIFAMVVLEKMLSKVYPEIDMVTTPSGKPVAMVHCNNCTSDINAWAKIFGDFARVIGKDMTRGQILDIMFDLADKGEADCGSVLSYNYFSGEPVSGVDEGRPMLLRTPTSIFTLENFMRTQLYSALATLKIGLDLLLGNEKASLDTIYGHGGFYIYPKVGQRMTSAAIGAPVCVMKTAGEGGPYGMAVLALYSIVKGDESLEDFLEGKVFADAECVSVTASDEDVAGFNAYLEKYKVGLDSERAAAAVK